MKWLVFTMIVFGGRLLALDLSQLELGAAATEKSDPAQAINAALFAGYYDGFVDGISSSGSVGKRSDRNAKPEVVRTYELAEWMKNRTSAAASLVLFIRTHRPAGFKSEEAAVDKLMAAWFLWNCKDSDLPAKFKGMALLSQTFGPNFPGAEEMRKQVAEGVKAELKAGAEFGDQ